MKGMPSPVKTIDTISKANPPGKIYNDTPFEMVNLPPWQHQSIGGRLIESQTGTYLDHDMGTGKTKTAIDAICNLPSINTALIFCPAAVVDVWPAEFQKHSTNAGVVVTPLTGPIRSRVETLEKTLASPPPWSEKLVFITNYEAVQSFGFARACHRPWDLVVCDEAHRVKSPGGVRSRRIAKIGSWAKKRLCLSGTPMPHSPLDIYAQFRFLDQGDEYGTSFARFRARYAIMGGFENRQVLQFINLDDLRERFYRVAHSVTKGDVLDLPPVMHVDRLVKLSPAAARIYRDMDQEFYAEVDKGVVTASNALVKMLRLQQVACGFVPTDGVWDDPAGTVQTIDTAKSEMLAEILDELDDSEPIVVFAKFRHDLDQIAQTAESEGRAYFELSGRAKELDAWKTWPGVCCVTHPPYHPAGAVLGVQIQSGGEGIDLTRACYAAYYSTGFSMGEYDQSLARLDRHGQTRPVTYYNILAEGTIDQKIRKAFTLRRDVINFVLSNR